MGAEDECGVGSGGGTREKVESCYMSGRKLSSWTQSSFFFLFLPHKVIF